MASLKQKKFTGSVSLLSWGYNEELLLENFFDRAVNLLESHVEDWEIIFVNDGSTDRSRAIADEYASREPRLRVFHNEENRDIGYSCHKAIRMAQKSFIFWQTVDWSYNLKNIPIFLQLTNHFDVVQGVRPTPIRLLSYIPVLRSIYRVKNRSDNFRKAIISLGNYYILRILFGIPFHDFQNITIYRRAIFDDIILRGNSSFINPECLFRAYDKGFSFIEVPIPFIPRTDGEAKGTRIKSILRSMGDIFLNWLRWGWKIRFFKHDRNQKHRQIYRVAEPFYLSDDVLRLIVTLFRDYR